MSESIRPLTSRERLVLRTCVFLAGAILMSLEILAFRIIGKTFGTALRETSVVIAVFLAAMSVGYWLGGRIGDRYPSMATFACSLGLAGGSTLVVPLLDRAVSDRVFSSSLPIALHSTLATVVLFVLPTLFLASISPIAVRLFLRGVEAGGSVAGSISAISTIGSILGSLATAFFLIDVLRSIARTTLVLGVATILLAILSAFSHLGSRKSRFATTVLLLVGTGAVVNAGISVWGTSDADAPTHQHVAGRVLFQRDSAFHHILVRELGSTRYLLFDNALQTKVNVADPLSGALEYTDYLHMPFVVDDTIRKVLVIGLGGGSGPKRMLHDYPNVVIDAVDIDPAVVDVARRFFALPDDPRLRIHIADGRAFLKRSNAKWDLIIVDAYTTSRYGSTIPPHVATREFFQEVREHLTARGWIVFNCAAGPDTPIAAAITRTINEVFPLAVIFPPRERKSTEIVARRSGALPSDPAEWSRLAQAGVDAKRLMLPDIVSRAARMRKPEAANAEILTDDYAPVDTLIRESGYL